MFRVTFSIETGFSLLLRESQNLTKKCYLEESQKELDLILYK